MAPLNKGTLTDLATPAAGDVVVGYDSTGAFRKIDVVNMPVSTPNQTALDGKSDVGHTHGDRYYTEAETDTLLAGKAAATHAHAAADITSGTLATARLGSGTADATTVLHGDQVWRVPSGSAGVTIQEEGVSLPTLATTVNFTGDGVTASGDGPTKTIHINTSGPSASEYVTPEDYGGIADNGVTDNGPPINDAFVAASTDGTKPVKLKFLSKRTYGFATQVIQKRSVHVEGGFKDNTSASGAERPTVLGWTGAAGATMWVVESIGQSRTWLSISNLHFRGYIAGGGVGSGRADHIIEIPDRLDSFATLTRIQFNNCNGNGLRLLNGAINAVIRDCRWDDVNGYGIYYVLKNPDNLRIEGATWDSVGANGVKGFLHVDGSLAAQNHYLRLKMDGTQKLEINTELHEDEAVFKFQGPANPISGWLFANLGDAYVAAASNIKNRTAILVTPPSDLVSIKADGFSRFEQIRGIPSMNQALSLTGSKANRNGLSVAPQGFTVNAPAGLGNAERTVDEGIGDENRMGGRRYVYGQPTETVFLANPFVLTDWPGPAQLFPGDLCKYDVTNTTAGQRYQYRPAMTGVTVQYCASPGVIGQKLLGAYRLGHYQLVSGISVTAASTTITLSATSDIAKVQAGDYVIVGNIYKEVLSVDVGTRVITLVSALTGLWVATSSSAPPTILVGPPVKLTVQAVAGNNTITVDNPGLIRHLDQLMIGGQNRRVTGVNPSTGVVSLSGPLTGLSPDPLPVGTMIEYAPPTFEAQAVIATS